MAKDEELSGRGCLTNADGSLWVCYAVAPRFRKTPRPARRRRTRTKEEKAKRAEVLMDFVRLSLGIEPKDPVRKIVEGTVAAIQDGAMGEGVTAELTDAGATVTVDLDAQREARRKESLKIAERPEPAPLAGSDEPPADEEEDIEEVD